MRRHGRWVVVAGAVVALVASAVYAQDQVRRGGGPGMRGGGGRGPGMGQGQMTQMMDQMLSRMNLTPAEEAAVREAMPKKLALYRDQRAELDKLDRVAREPGSSDEQLQRAVRDYLAARLRFARPAAVPVRRTRASQFARPSARHARQPALVQ